VFGPNSALQPTRGGRPVLTGCKSCGRRGRLSFMFGGGKAGCRRPAAQLNHWFDDKEA